MGMIVMRLMEEALLSYLLPLTRYSTKSTSRIPAALTSATTTERSTFSSIRQQICSCVLMSNRISAISEKRAIVCTSQMTLSALRHMPMKKSFVLHCGQPLSLKSSVALLPAAVSSASAAFSSAAFRPVNASSAALLPAAASSAALLPAAASSAALLAADAAFPAHPAAVEAHAAAAFLVLPVKAAVLVFRRAVSPSLAAAAAAFQSASFAVSGFPALGAAK